MASIVQSAVYNPLMSTYAALGLTTPITRFVATAVVAGAGMLVLKPGFAFSGGNARPWVLVDPNNKEGTLFPWYLVPAAAGFFGGFMI